MRERIILAPGANGSEMLKNLAGHGVNCFNLRIVSAGELARIAMMRSGIAITEDFISRREEIPLVAKAVKEEAYFGKTTYSDIQEIAKAIRQMRMLVADGDETEQIEGIMSRGIFAEKNTALIAVYKKYMRSIADKKLMDSVSLIRKAAAECNPIDADFIKLKEYPLTPLDKALLHKVSGGKVQESSLTELYHLDGSQIRINSFRNCYGAANEVESILTDIYSSKHLDKCCVAVTDPVTYGQLFFDYALRHDMPITFGCGIPIINSNPAGLLAQYYHWMTGGFFGTAAIQELLSSAAFDKSKLADIYPETDECFRWDIYADVLGGLRLTNDKTTNDRRLEDFQKAIAAEEAIVDPGDEKAYQIFCSKKSCIPHLEVIAKELAMPVEDFILKYSYIRKGSETNAQRLLMMLDLASTNVIYEELKVIHTSGVEMDVEDMIQNVLKMSVANAGSERGKLHITGVDGALSCVREHLYIAGLSASKYPGSPRENYLLLDTDLRMFGGDAEYMTSDGLIERRHDSLLTLAGFASGLGADINVSYAGLNVSELKKDNASSLVYELYCKESGKSITAKELEAHITKVDYFEPAISATRKVGEAYNCGKMITPHPAGEAKEAVSVHLNLDGAYSPSALSTFFNCPRAFMLSVVLGIAEPDDDRPFEVISAKESGSIVHELMKELGNSEMTKEEFLELSGECFDRFIDEHPPLVDKNAETERDLFLDMMETAYSMDPHREVVLKEENIQCVHNSGVKIQGFPDRIEKLEDGSCLVVDFKSARKISHVRDDIDTCLQIVLYAYLMEQKGYQISGGEFRYIRLGETVSCKYDDEMKQQLFEKLYVFKKHMEAADFPIPDNAYEKNRKDEDPDPCKYCSFSMICGKGQETGGQTDE